jgi:hypothetical protein
MVTEQIRAGVNVGTRHVILEDHLFQYGAVGAHSLWKSLSCYKGEDEDIKQIRFVNLLGSNPPPSFSLYSDIGITNTVDGYGHASGGLADGLTYDLHFSALIDRAFTKDDIGINMNGIPSFVQIQGMIDYYMKDAPDWESDMAHTIAYAAYPFIPEPFFPDWGSLQWKLTPSDHGILGLTIIDGRAQITVSYQSTTQRFWVIFNLIDW